MTIDETSKNNYFSIKISTLRLLAISSFSFSLTLVTNTLDPAVFGHIILKIANPNQYNTVLGFSTFAGALISIIIFPIIGSFSDRTSSKIGSRFPYFIIGSVILIFSLYLIASSPSIAIFSIGVILYYAGSNIIDGPWMALYPDLIPENSRGRASGIKAFVDILALILGRLIAGYIMSNAEKMGGLAPIYSVTIPTISLLLSLIITWNAIKTSIKPINNIKKKKITNIIKESFNVNFDVSPNFKWWFGNRFFFWAAFNILGTFLLFFTIDVIGLVESEAQLFLGKLTTVIGICILFIVIPSGKASDKYGPRPLIILAGFVASFGTIYILIIKNIILLYVGGAIIGGAAGVFVSANFSMLTKIAPPNESARYMGIAMIASTGGSAFARLLGGIIVDPLNSFYPSNSAGYIVLFSMASIFYFISSIYGIKIIDTK